LILQELSQQYEPELQQYAQICKSRVQNIVDLPFVGHGFDGGVENARLENAGLETYGTPRVA